ncbi:hypothetical protein BH09MYX1_BH09MYX1_56190 [soil metagenome]
MHPRPSRTSATVRETLLADHARLEALIVDLLAAFDADDRERVGALWNDLDRGLGTHLEAEETFLIPALMRTRRRDATAILAEHKHIRGRMLELGTGVDLHIVRADTAHAFVQELRAHARHEEKLYEWADATLGAPEHASLVSAVAAE